MKNSHNLITSWIKIKIRKNPQEYDKDFFLDNSPVETKIMVDERLTKRMPTKLCGLVCFPTLSMDAKDMEAMIWQEDSVDEVSGPKI